MPEPGAPAQGPALIVVTGPSGVGKGTLIRDLLERVPGLALSTSATTRAPRAGEVDGRDYHFITPEEFEERVAAGEFLEHATYAGNRYGTPRSELERTDVRGLVLEIEVQGARQVAEAVPDALQVYVVPPTPEALRERLLGRGTDSPEEMEARLARAREELEEIDAEHADHVIVNDDLAQAAQELVRVVDTMLDPDPEGSPS
jgi:guanylate kinase